MYFVVAVSLGLAGTYALCVDVSDYWTRSTRTAGRPAISNVLASGLMVRNGPYCHSPAWSTSSSIRPSVWFNSYIYQTLL